MKKSGLRKAVLSAILASSMISGGIFAQQTVWAQSDNSLYYSFPAEGTTSAPYMMATTLYPIDQPYKAVTIDWKCDQDAENTYWCAHNWYNSSSDYSQAVDGSGYAGFQNINGHHVTIFSLWNSPNGNPTIEYSREDAYTDNFGGEGTGKKVVIPYDWEVDKWYTMRIQAWSDEQKTYYEQWVKPENGQWELLAQISFPVVGIGMTWDASFMEDFCLNNLFRGGSYAYAYGMKADGSWVSANSIQFDHYDSKYMNAMNSSEHCGVFAGDWLWSMAAGGDFSQGGVQSFPQTLTVQQPDLPQDAGWIYYSE